MKTNLSHKQAFQVLTLYQITLQADPAHQLFALQVAFLREVIRALKTPEHVLDGQIQKEFDSLVLMLHSKEIHVKQQSSAPSTGSLQLTEHDTIALIQEKMNIDCAAKNDPTITKATKQALDKLTPKRPCS